MAETEAPEQKDAHEAGKGSEPKAQGDFVTAEESLHLGARQSTRSTMGLPRKKQQAHTEKSGLDDHMFDSTEILKEEYDSNLKELMSAPRGRVHAKGKSKAVIMFMPTYRLEPTHIFKYDKAEKLMIRVLEFALAEPYNEATSPVVAQALAKTMLSHIKMPRYNTERYKLACHIRIVQKKFQGYYEKITALWMHDYDRVVTTSVESETLIAVANLSIIYFD